RVSLQRLPAGRCVLVLDDTQQTTHCTLSTLVLDYGGRAVPLAWCRWSGRLHGRYWAQIEGLFQQAERILPAHVQPVVLAARGLASPRLISLIQQRGWDYLVRVQRDTTLRTDSRRRSPRVPARHVDRPARSAERHPRRLDLWPWRAVGAHRRRVAARPPGTLAAGQQPGPRDSSCRYVRSPPC